MLRRRRQRTSPKPRSLWSSTTKKPEVGEDEPEAEEPEAEDTEETEVEEPASDDVDAAFEI
jgi:hypothetical protein